MMDTDTGDEKTIGVVPTLCPGPTVVNFKGEYGRITNLPAFLVDSSLFFICLQFSS